MKKNIFISFYKTKWIKSLHFAMYKNLRAANVTSRFIFVMFLLVLTSCKQDNIIEPIPPCFDCPINFKVVDSEPAWSPDGKTIVYIHGDINPAKHGLYLIDTSGNNNRLLLNGIYFDSPTWSPDGEWIAFSMSSQIYKIKKDGTQLTQLTSKGRNFGPDWSPDGVKIIFDNTDCGDQVTPPASNACGVMLISNNGENKHRIFGGGFPQWADSFTIYAIIGESSTVIDNNFIKYNLLDGSLDTIYLATSLEILFPRVLKDNLLFTAIHYDLPKIYKYNLDSKEIYKFREGYSQDFSPDGNFIVYTKSDTLNGNLWIMTSNGVDVKALTKKGGD